MIPVDKDTLLSRAELQAAIAGPIPRARLRRPRSAVRNKSRYLVGMPLFDLISYKENGSIVCPAYQARLALAGLRSATNKETMVENLKSEYKSIIETLTALDVDFHVLNLEEGDRDIRQWLLGRGCVGVRLPSKRPYRWLLYPRDMFVSLEAVDTLLVHSRLFEIQHDHGVTCEIIRSRWGEGGRVLFRGDRMLVGGHPEAKRALMERWTIDRLREKGMHIATLPFAISARISRRNGAILSLSYETHLDRGGSLIEGRDGGLHLILDPGYRTGRLIDPLPVRKSIELVRRACEKIQVKVHVPRGLSVPYGISLVQFQDRKVLASGGDDGILACLEDILGSENLRTTEVPISSYPVFAAAGLHCLITENPDPLVEQESICNRSHNGLPHFRSGGAMGMAGSDQGVAD
jgi:hypothetical protein